jgi:hypothetical protein
VTVPAGGPPGDPARILLAAAGAALGTQDGAPLAAALAASPDWPRVLEQAAWHGVRPLLDVALGPAGPAVPEAVRARLAAARRDNLRRSLALTGELLKVLAALERCSVPAVPFKGPALAAELYGDLGLREFSDLDVLVPEAEVPRAAAILRAAGYRPRYALGPAQERAYVAAQHEYLFSRADGLIVELQWRVAPRAFACPLDYRAMWQRLGSATLADRKVPALAAEDLLLLLCVHGGRHLWTRLLWVCDLAALLRARPDLDWTLVRSAAAAAGAGDLVGLGLALAGRLLGAALPPGPAARGLVTPRAARLAGETGRRLFETAARRPGLVASLRFHLRSRERPADRARHLARLLLAPSPGDLSAVRLPRALFPLYYPVRAVRLAVKYGHQAVQHLRPGARA